MQRTMRASILALVLFLYATACAAAGGGYLNIYADPQYRFCWMEDYSGRGGVTVYVVHQQTDGAVGCRFMLAWNFAFGGVYLSESSPHSSTGDVRAGISVDYGECRTGTVLVAQIQYHFFGYSTACSWLLPVPDPAAASGIIEVTDCEGAVVAGNAHPLAVNDTYTCPDPPWCAPTTPVEQSTWGAVKALYEDE